MKDEAILNQISTTTEAYTHSKKVDLYQGFLYLLSDLHNCLPIILGCLAMTGITHLILYNKFHHKNLL